MKRSFACVLAMAGALAAVAPGVAAQSVVCDVASIQAKAPTGTTITAAAMVEGSATRPRFCQVDGHAASAGNSVNFRLGLPEGWNGKFLFLGVGGLGGTLAALDPGLTRGYATATTDTGHRASEADWASNRAKEIDYGYRGTHVSTVAAKALTASFYGAPPKYAYFEGCSNGGRQALMEVQRYPDDFDGVIGGHPATGTPMQVGRAVVYQQMLSSPDAFLSPAAIELVSKASLAACDKADGLEDGLVSDPRPCRFDPSTLACRGAATEGCLTPGQVATVAQIYGGVKTPDGQIYAHGFPPGHEGGATGWTQWIAGQAPPAAQENGSLAYAGPRLPSGYGLMDFNFQFLALEQDDPGYGWRQFDVARDLPRMRTMTEILSPLDADLRPFAKSGGKLLMYHGWSDPGISALGTLDYYERVVRTVGGQSAADRFVRTYFVPGMHHCGGGPGPTAFAMLPVLESWVEKDVAPTSVLASRVVEGKTVRTRPLCPHPQVARYRGTGSIDEAASFVCAAP